MMAPWNVHLMAVILHAIILAKANGQLYKNTMSILRDKLAKDVYDPQVRPLRDQSKAMTVFANFYLVSLVEVNDVTQSFVCNGFLSMDWTDEVSKCSTPDEMVAWDPKDYGGEDLIHPLPQDIWRPKILLMNTIAARDLFGDDEAPLFVFSNGKVRYAPGALFPTSCELDLDKFPFDTQNCVIELASMNQVVEEMNFRLSSGPEVYINLFIPHVEWNLVSTYIEIVNRTNIPITYSALRINFVLKRRPAFLLLNIILPVVFLSFLNILVFIIPAQSGEKLGFGITVLLALAVFLSFVSTILPRSSRSLPRVTIYLFILLVISLLTVIDSIIIVYLHYLEQRAKKHYRKAVKKRNGSSEHSTHKQSEIPKSGKDSSLPLTLKPSTDIDTLEDADKYTTDDLLEVNKYKAIGKYIDRVSLIVFMIIWTIVTVVFMLNLTSDVNE